MGLRCLRSLACFDLRPCDRKTRLGMGLRDLRGTLCDGRDGASKGGLLEAGPGLRLAQARRVSASSSAGTDSATAAGGEVLVRDPSGKTLGGFCRVSAAHEEPVS